MGTAPFWRECKCYSVLGASYCAGRSCGRALGRPRRINITASIYQRFSGSSAERLFVERRKTRESSWRLPKPPSNLPPHPKRKAQLALIFSAHSSTGNLKRTTRTFRYSRHPRRRTCCGLHVALSSHPWLFVGLLHRHSTPGKLYHIRNVQN